MEDCGCASPHHLQEITLRASRVKLQKILQITEIENIPNFIQRQEIGRERLSLRKLTE
jgi:hypothetical protein